MAVRGGVQLGEASGSSMWLFFFREKRVRRPFRGGAGRGLARSSFGHLDVHLFFFARSDFGGPSVAVRGGFQLGAASGSSMSHMAQKSISAQVSRLSLKELRNACRPAVFFIGKSCAFFQSGVHQGSEASVVEARGQVFT